MVNIKIRLVIFFAAKDGETLYSQLKKKKDQEVSVAQIMNSFIVKFRLTLKKFGKTTRPFSYDINQIPHDYTVEVTKRFKGLDLIDRVPEELWKDVCDTVQEAVIKTISRKRNAKRHKETCRYIAVLNYL